MRYIQRSFPAGTPGNGVPKVILTVGTAFKPALGELYKKHPVCTKIRLFEIQNRTFFLGRSLGRSDSSPVGRGTSPPHTHLPQRLRRQILAPTALELYNYIGAVVVPPFANPGALTVWFPHFLFVGNDPWLYKSTFYLLLLTYRLHHEPMSW